MGKAEKAKGRFGNEVQLHERYAERIPYIIKYIREYFETAEKLHEIARRFHNTKADAQSEIALHDMKSELNELKWIEGWQQLWHGCPKLKRYLKGLLKFPVLTSQQRENIRKLLPTLEIWERSLEVDTKQQLGPSIIGGPNQINWEKVKSNLAQIEKHSRALLAVILQIEKELGIPSVLQKVA